MLEPINSNQMIDFQLKKSLTDSGISLDFFSPVFTYFTFLLKENENLNLISRSLTEGQIISDHIYDCLVAAKYFQPYSTITDLGTGAGLPGVLLAIIFSDKKIQLIEKSPKKCIFLNKVIKLLRLENIELFQGLVTDCKIKSEVITCRGFKDILSILMMTESFFRRKGVYILYKGKAGKIEEEIIQVKKYYHIDKQIIKLNINIDKERHLCILQEKGS